MRRTKEDAARTRAAIVDAALCCFDRHGIGSSTVDQIAAAAQVTKGAVYHHFGGKRQILQALRDQVSLPMLDAADTKLLRQSGIPALERVERFLLSFLDVVEKDPRTRQALTVMQFKCEYVEEMNRELMTACRNQDRLLHAFQGAYGEAKREGALRRDLVPAAVAIETIMFLSGLMRLSLLHPATHPVRKGARAAIRAHVRSKKA